MDTNVLSNNYIIAHHLTTSLGLPKIYRLPMYPDQVSDSINSKFVSTDILGRTAPLQSWAGSGPRVVSFTIRVHRDLDWDGTDGSRGNQIGDIGELMDTYQALTLPNKSEPMRVRTPLITVSIGSGILVTGIPNITYQGMKPIDENGNYLQGEFSFSVTEVDPYDAETVYSQLHNARGNRRSVQI